jgi:HK97 family phage prohead protease
VATTPTAILERKSFPVELKADDDKPGHFSGYASVFGNVDSYGDVMAKGAFARSLTEFGMPMLSWEHAWELGPVGVLTSVEEDERGLKFEGDLFIDSDLPNRIHRAIKAKQVKQASFAFLKRDWEDDAEIDGQKVRLLKDVDLPEVAIVVLGANTATAVEARSALERSAVKVLDEVLEEKAVDNSAWDGSAAMSACSDAACYRAICAGRKAGDPDLRSSWALPHHKSADAAPNAAGVRNALARFDQTEGLTNSEAARSHLEAHMREISPDTNSVPLNPAAAAGLHIDDSGHLLIGTAATSGTAGTVAFPSVTYSPGLQAQIRELPDDDLEEPDPRIIAEVNDLMLDLFRATGEYHALTNDTTSTVTTDGDEPQEVKR